MRDERWIGTYGGGRAWPLAPDVDQVDVAAVAHALALTCRFGGHCRTFYSVAEHSVRVSRWVHRLGGDLTAQLWGLWHDGAEAFLGDQVRPVKRALWLEARRGCQRSYADLERAWQNAIAFRLGLPLYLPELVGEVDGRLLADEAAALFDDVSGWQLAEPLGDEGFGWDCGLAETEFLRRHAQLAGLRADVAAASRGAV